MGCGDGDGGLSLAEYFRPRRRTWVQCVVHCPNLFHLKWRTRLSDVAVAHHPHASVFEILLDGF
jgi:hypothetical protein